MNYELILGTPFLTLLYPFSVDEKGLKTQVLGKEIIFEFISPPKTRDLLLLQESSIKKLNVIEKKKQQIKYLNQDIIYKRIEEQLESNQIKSKIKIIEEKILKEICDLNPIAFWHRKKHEISLPYIDNFNEKEVLR